MDTQIKITDSIANKLIEKFQRKKNRKKEVDRMVSKGTTHLIHFLIDNTDKKLENDLLERFDFRGIDIIDFVSLSLSLVKLKKFHKLKEYVDWMYLDSKQNKEFCIDLLKGMLKSYNFTDIKGKQLVKEIYRL